MPIAPRQGRKGGKISSSPAIASSDSPSMVSPGSLPSGSAGISLPTDPNTTLQFNIEALMSKKRRSPSKAKAAARANESSASASSATEAVKAASGTRGASTTAAAGSAGASAAAGPAETIANPSLVTPPGADSNVFKFDLDAIQQVGQGVVFGGNKTMRTDSHKPDSDPAVVSAKLKQLIASQDAYFHGGNAAAADVESDEVLGLKEVASHQVVLLQRPYAALRLAVALSRKSKERVLVVVPHYSDVSDIAAALRALSPSRGPVGELSGQSFVGEADTALWVTDVDTALVYLTSQRGMGPFTHLVLPNLTRMNPLVSYFLWGLRERVYRQSAILDTTAPPLHVIVSVSGAMTERMQQFFAKQTVATPNTAPVQPLVEFSYDEANALAEMDVLDVTIDESGKYPGPHRKIIDHSVQMAATLVGRIFSCSAACPQAIYILTGDSREMIDALHKERLLDTTVYAGRFPSKEDAGATPSKHRVCVLHSVVSFTNYNNEDATFVLDMATTRRLAVQNKSEGFMASSASEWASKMDVEERRQLPGAKYPGCYIALYPPAADAVLPTTEAPQPTVYEVEDALLQCSRAQLPIQRANQEMVCPVEAESIEQVQHSLSEKCLIANLSDFSLTFTGEIASRLPLEVDLAHFVMNCCTLGHGEVGVIVAGVCALPYRFPTGESAEGFASWKRCVIETRQEYAGDIANQSDLLADVLVFLEWWRLKASGASTADFVAKMQLKEDRLEHVRGLITYLRVQISDYAFVDDLEDEATLSAVMQSIKSNASIFTFFEAVALARRLFFVRDAGSINVKDRAGALVFVRTSKKVVPNTASPSSVVWESGAALVAVDLRNLVSNITCARVSAVNNTYLFAALLLLYPQVEYSAPVEVPSKGGRVVYFGVTCNRQMKRFRVSIGEAAQILDFREKWNHAIRYLQVLRTAKKPLSRHKFNFMLKEEDRHFDLEELRAEVQRELQNLVTEIEVAEHQASFTTHGVHCLAPKQVAGIADSVDASDVDVSRKFHDGDLWTSSFASKTDTPATMAAATSITANHALTTTQSSALTFPMNAVSIDDDEDDEVEVMEELYFRMNGPIIDDDE
ncbi:protein of unknown function - conserved [Leishmania donovani]|uniref:Uncharacterized protein n=3 Tax=Leishmania donovani species complex TaxID=38574 RepID=A4IBM7_LEIIN|nr:conserved hypothetical protein [Leishmania infantum JPCM5]XP_003864922.1 hypothetical protein, conserved [Leishmania donovani]CAC9545874.1 hypothetical_protein_-_conserved [Leishmania infantum]AYU83142.1 hypothetical protein LdCL_350039200 [Leishmania donovani]TPP44602.1 hypothetical protein CGC21_7175 [Leishmania donovani]TPP47992.1 hypothetical protein CGC20_15030 [Leishmania donovani]CAJ1993151.1 protein of unknown function - conserved [Leishmania donovani]|eukprot:XP_001469146.1 conserved hypothetical protein [Leishmania infantum JPCM5]